MINIDVSIYYEHADNIGLKHVHTNPVYISRNFLNYLSGVGKLT
jgi:hypothetical protein